MIEITFTITVVNKGPSHQVDVVDMKTATSSDLRELWKHVEAYDPKEAIRRKIVEICQSKNIDPALPFPPQT